jgi:hypothetical protein
MPKPLRKNQSSEMSLVFFSSSGVPILMGDDEGKSEERFFVEKEFFKTGGSPASKSTSTTVLEAKRDADKVGKGCLKHPCKCPERRSQLDVHPLREVEL